MKALKRDVQLIIVLLAIVLFVVLYIFIHLPLQREIAEVEIEITTLEPQLKVLEEHNLALPTYQQKIDEVTTLSHNLVTDFPAGVKEEDMLVWFLNMEQDINFNFTDISFVAPAVFSQFQGLMLVDGVNSTVDITSYKTGATVNGAMNYHQLKDSLDYIYASPDRTALENLTISYNPVEANLATSIAVSKYYLEYPGSEYIQTPMPNVSIGTPQLFGSLTDDLADAAIEDAEDDGDE